MLKKSLFIVIQIFSVLFIVSTTLAFQLEVSASQTNVSVNSSVNFTCAPSDGSPPYTYSWNFDDHSSYKYPTTTANPSHTFLDLGRHYVWVTVTDSTAIEERALVIVDVGLGSANIKDAITDCGCVDDGITNNTPALQNCLNAYQNSRVTIKFRTMKKGVYLFNQASGTGGGGNMAYAFILNGSDQVTLQGDSSRPTLKWQNTSAVDDKQDGFIAFGACSNVKVMVRNFNIIRDMQGESHVDTDSQVFFRNEPTSGLKEYMEDCTLTDFTALSGGLTGTIKRCNFSGYGKYRPYDLWPGRIPLVYFHDRSMMKKLYSTNGAAGSTHHYYGSGDYAYIIENYMDGSGQDTARLGIFLKASEGDHVGVKVIGNIIRNTTGTPLAMGKHDQTQIDFVIKGNRFLNAGDPDGGFAIDTGPITSATFVGNFTSDTPYSSYYFEANNVSVLFKDNIAGYNSGSDAGKNMVRCDGTCNLIQTGSLDNADRYVSTDPSGWWTAGVGYNDPGPWEYAPPVNCTVSVEGDSENVTLLLSAEDVGSGMGADARFPHREGALMQFSNDGLTWSEVRPYNESTNWRILADGEGPYTVYARFRDRDGNWRDSVSSSLIQAPTNLRVVY